MKKKERILKMFFITKTKWECAHGKFSLFFRKKCHQQMNKNNSLEEIFRKGAQKLLQQAIEFEV